MTAATPCQRRLAPCTDDEVGVGHNGWPNAFAKYEALASSLPASQGLGSATYLKHGNVWYPEHLMAPTLAMRDTFVARPTDVILATIPKSGTTWLALVFCVMRRHSHAPDDARHPLLGSSPHDLVPFLHSFYESRSVPPGPRLEAMPSPRILAVHAPFSNLPASAIESGVVFSAGVTKPESMKTRV